MVNFASHILWPAKHTRQSYGCGGPYLLHLFYGQLKISYRVMGVVAHICFTYFTASQTYHTESWVWWPIFASHTLWPAKHTIQSYGCGGPYLLHIFYSQTNIPHRVMGVPLPDLLESRQMAVNWKVYRVYLLLEFLLRIFCHVYEARNDSLSLITARKRSLGQGNMFTGVCLSTRLVPGPGGAWSQRGACSEGCLLLRGVAGSWGLPALGGACSRGYLLREVGFRGVPGGDPLMVTGAGSTHPTGMHSCYTCFYACQLFSSRGDLGCLNLGLGVSASMYIQGQTTP